MIFDIIPPIDLLKYSQFSSSNRTLTNKIRTQGSDSSETVCHVSQIVITWLFHQILSDKQSQSHLKPEVAPYLRSLPFSKSIFSLILQSNSKEETLTPVPSLKGGRTRYPRAAEEARGRPRGL